MNKLKKAKADSNELSNANITADKVENAITELSAENKKNFVQTVDAGVNIEGINFKQTLNRIGFDVVLPHPFKKIPKIALFAVTPNFIENVEKAFGKVIPGDQIPTLEKKAIKKLAGEFDMFFAEPAAMALVGKHLGQVLAPRGKMPKPCPPSLDAVKAFINNTMKSVTISNKKGNSLPVVHFPIGKQDMPVKDIVENFMTCYSKLLTIFPGNTQNVKSVYIKTTMSPIKYLFKRWDYESATKITL